MEPMKMKLLGLFAVLMLWQWCGGNIMLDSCPSGWLGRGIALLLYCTLGVQGWCSGESNRLPPILSADCSICLLNCSIKRDYPLFRNALLYIVEQFQFVNSIHLPSYFHFLWEKLFGVLFIYQINFLCQCSEEG